MAREAPLRRNDATLLSKIASLEKSSVEAYPIYAFAALTHKNIPHFGRRRKRTNTCVTNNNIRFLLRCDYSSTRMKKSWKTIGSI
jgi:hypothetical protein